MGLREVKKELDKLDKSELLKHIAELYKKFKPVKEYYDFYLNPVEDSFLEKYKERVRSGFYPKRGFDLKLSISRKAINDFKKLGASNESLANLLLYYVECGVEFTSEYGDIDENFYISVENTYAASLELMSKEGILDKFQDRALAIVEKTRHMGWGFYDGLLDTYSEHFD